MPEEWIAEHCYFSCPLGWTVATNLDGTAARCQSSEIRPSLEADTVIIQSKDSSGDTLLAFNTDAGTISRVGIEKKEVVELELRPINIRREPE